MSRSRSESFRRLVCCERCGKQFDASHFGVGERFRCLCGATLEVQRAQAQESPVVRCASCGAPRAAGAVNCTFCQAPLTLPESERNTLCPGCGSRIGDRQRFCHGCGLRIAPEEVAGGRSDYSCPSCRPERRLSSRKVPDAMTPLALLECGSCAGVWLGHPTFDALQEKARRDAVPAPGAAAPATGAHGGKSGEITYRPCPVCRKLMVRRAFAGSSGIVLDVCRNHGLWFDADELDATLAWIRAGGLTRTEERLAAERREAARREESARRDLKPVLAEEPEKANWIDLLASLAEMVLDAVKSRR